MEPKYPKPSEATAEQLAAQLAAEDEQEGEASPLVSQAVSPTVRMTDAEKEEKRAKISNLIKGIQNLDNE